MSSSKAESTSQNRQREDFANVLIVDDDPQFGRFMLEILARKAIRGIVAPDRKTALDLLDKDRCDLLFITDSVNAVSEGADRNRDSLRLLREIRTDFPELPVVMIATDHNHESTDSRRTVAAAVNAIRDGCADFLVKPLSSEKIEALLDTFLPNHSVVTQASAHDHTKNLYRIVGKSPRLIQIIDLAKRVAPTSIPVLVSGESGTGKELISYLIHHESKRFQGPYVKVNCAALSDSLLESELFGHERGAFTGAFTKRKGRFEMAHGGTLLLDEITETPLGFQAKLLRVIEQQDFERVGGNENVRVNVRIISTTNKDLLYEARQGCFRPDLYYRLSGVRLVLAPLKKRIEDLPDLVWHFVNLYARETQRQITRLDPVMMEMFARYDWPGNVRQLRNVVRTSLILGTGPTLSLADVSWLFDELQPLPQQARSRFDTNTKSNHTRTEIPGQPQLAGIPLERIERQAILETLRQTAGNRTKAAKVLGISDRTLRDKVRRYRQQGCLQLA